MTDRYEMKTPPPTDDARQKDAELALAQARIELAILRYEIESSKYQVAPQKQEKVRL